MLKSNGFLTLGVFVLLRFSMLQRIHLQSSPPVSTEGARQVQGKTTVRARENEWKKQMEKSIHLPLVH